MQVRDSPAPARLLIMLREAMSNDTFWLLAGIAFIVYYAVFSIRKKLDELGKRIVWALSTPEEREKKIQEADRELEWNRKGRNAALLILLAIVVAGVVIWWILRTP
jgi:hypothetical protein